MGQTLLTLKSNWDEKLKLDGFWFFSTSLISASNLPSPKNYVSSSKDGINLK